MKKNIKQKLLGAVLVAGGVIIAASTKDLTLSFVLVPLGLWAICTKEDIFD
jgi:hypothetical protein